MIVVCFGKFTDDKEDGVRLTGVYFGGLANDSEEANKIAKECSNSIRGIMIKTATLEPDTLPTAIKKIAMKFRAQELQMRENQDTIARTISSRKKRS